MVSVSSCRQSADCDPVLPTLGKMHLTDKILCVHNIPSQRHEKIKLQFSFPRSPIPDSCTDHKKTKNWSTYRFTCSMLMEINKKIFSLAFSACFSVRFYLFYWAVALSVVAITFNAFCGHDIRSEWGDSDLRRLGLQTFHALQDRG